jgi:hypothetical protein
MIRNSSKSRYTENINTRCHRTNTKKSKNIIKDPEESGKLNRSLNLALTILFKRDLDGKESSYGFGSIDQNRSYRSTDTGRTKS